MRNKPRVYVAGPMRGHPNANFDNFDRVANLLRKSGFAVVNPADLDRVAYDFVDYPDESLGEQPDVMRDAIRRDLDVLLTFSADSGDAICMLHGWSQSAGACVEYALAKYLGLSVLFENELWF